jgi:hypothetical protein
MMETTIYQDRLGAKLRGNLQKRAFFHGIQFEGGTRVASFVSGGALPAARRGKTASGLVHICDWLGAKKAYIFCAILYSK